MPTAATIGPRGLARLTAVFFLTTALMLAAFAAYARFVGGGGAGLSAVVVIAVVCAGAGVVLLRAASKAAFGTAARIRPLPTTVRPPIEILPADQEQERPEGRY